MKNANELKKMDDLGRIIIPKRIRNILGIRENDYFEVFYDDNGVYFKKYNNIGEIESAIVKAEVCVRNSNLPEEKMLSILKKIGEIEKILHKEEI